MAYSRSVADQRAAEEREQQQLEQFLAHAARTPELQTRLRGVDPYEVVEIAAAAGYPACSPCTGLFAPATPCKR